MLITFKALRYELHSLFSLHIITEQIKLWDIRVRRSVKQYEGHHNEYAYLPIHVNEPEGLLLAGTSFSYNPHMIM